MSRTFNLNVVVDNQEYLAGSLPIPLESLDDKSKLLDFLEDSNYIILGYDELSARLDHNSFDVLCDDSIILSAYFIPT